MNIEIWRDRISIGRGARPVIYGNAQELKGILPSSEYWRIVDMELSVNHIVDWSHEREWRMLDVCKFEYDDIEVIVKNDLYYRKFIQRYINEQKLDLLTEIRGIVPLNVVIS